MDLRTEILEALIAGERACDIQKKHGLTNVQYYQQIRAGKRTKSKINVAKHIAKYLDEQGRDPIEIQSKKLRHNVAEIMGVRLNGDDEPNPDNRPSNPLTDEIQEDLQMFSILASRLLRTEDIPEEVYKAVDTAQTRIWQWQWAVKGA